MTATTYPTKGDRVVVPVLSGYKLVQNRPFDCRYSCHCGTCNGSTTEYPGTVDNVIYWADNSVEAEVRCDDGEMRLLRLKPPSGDVC